MPTRIFELSDLNGANGFMINGITADDNSGFQVASACDLNGDGIGDIITGAPHPAQAYVVYGRNTSWPRQFELSSLSNHTGVLLNGLGGHRGGSATTCVGDINGDGSADILIGAHFFAPNGRLRAGQSYLLFGQEGRWPALLPFSGSTVIRSVSINGISAGDESGFSVAPAGDVNGDSIDDFLIGARGASPDGRLRAGQAYIVFGQRGPWSPTLELSSLNGDTGAILNGYSAENRAGLKVARAGDINADGLGDFLVGSPEEPDGSGGPGRTYLVFGRIGLWPSSIELFNLNGTTGVVINGVALGDESGSALASAGDINADGIDDFLVGARAADLSDRGGNNSGQVYIVFGNSGDWPATLELSELNGVTGVTINGISGGDRLGWAVASAGDVNGDGIADIILSADYKNRGEQLHTGQCYVIFGRRVWPAVIELSNLDVESGIIINGIAANDFLAKSVAPIGDVNGDGEDDVILGAHKASPGGRISAGQSYVIFGGAEQFSANEITIETGEFLQLNVSNLAVEPLVDDRNFTVTDVEHGRFALVSAPNNTVTQFTQKQINDGDVLFIHNESDKAPSYKVSADGVIRVFSKVRQQAANISFIERLTTTNTITSISRVRSEISTLTSFTSSTALMTASTTTTSIFDSRTPLFHTAPLLSSTLTTYTSPRTISAFVDNTQQVDIGNTDNGFDSGAIAGGVIGGLAAMLALLMVSFFYRRRRRHTQQNVLDRQTIDGRSNSIAMENNPVFIVRASAPNGSSENPATGVGGYFDTSGPSDKREKDDANYVQDWWPSGTDGMPGAELSASSYSYAIFNNIGETGTTTAEHDYAVIDDTMELPSHLGSSQS